MSIHDAHGFTLMEIMIVVSISALLLLTSGVLFSTTIGRNQTENVAQDIVSTLRRSQWQSMNGHDDEVWGVHFESDAFTLFQGATYSVSHPENVVTDLPNDITISTVTINGGGTDIVFTSDFGDTDDYGSVLVEQGHSEEERTIVVNAVGMVDVN